MLRLLLLREYGMVKPTAALRYVKGGGSELLHFKSSTTGGTDDRILEKKEITYVIQKSNNMATSTFTFIHYRSKVFSTMH